MTVRHLFPLLVFLTSSAAAQIYADLSVSKGDTGLGTFRARLDHDKAPRTCANFIGLATGERDWIDPSTYAIQTDTPFYDGLVFHRLIHNFVIQGGSSNGQGTAGSGYIIQDEFHPDLRHSGPYILSMAKSSLPGTGNSQFFITLAATPHLDDKHSVFGEVIEGRGIIDGFADPTLHPTEENDRPVTPISIDSVEISGPSLADFDPHDPAHELPAISGVRPSPSRDNAELEFATRFHRKPQTDYLYSYSFDLKAWTPFRHILSLDREEDYEFILNELEPDRFFSRVNAIDYSHLVNPPGDLLPADASLTFTSRAGDSLTITSDGDGGGTWSDSTGASGALVSLSAEDGVPSEGVSPSESPQSHLIPLAQVAFQLDAAGGPANRTHYQQVTLDFRTENSGWTDGRASNNGSSPVAVLHAFTYSPAP